MRVLVTGNQKIGNADLKVFVKKLIEALDSANVKLDDITEVIRGDSVGAENLMQKIAEHKKIPVTRYSHDKENYGKLSRLVNARENLLPNTDLAVIFDEDSNTYVDDLKRTFASERRPMVIVKWP